MNWTELRYFYAVVAEGNFTKAAKRLRIAQPAISRMVKRLEDNLGAPVLIRHKRHVELTALGNAVHRYCKVIFDSVEQIEALSRSPRPAIEGPVSIATSDVIATMLFPEALMEVAKANPKVLPLVLTAPTSSMLTKISTGDVDFGIFFYVPPEQVSLVEVTELAKIKFRLVVSRLKRNDPSIVSSFIGSREIDSPNTRQYPALDKLRKRHPSAQIRFSANNLGLHKEMVLKGAGVAILPEFLVSTELKNGLLKDVLPKEQFRFSLNLVKHKHRPLSPAAKAFLDQFKKLTSHIEIRPHS